MVTRADLAAADLRLRLGALLRGLRAAVERRQARTAALARPEIAHLAITQQHAQAALGAAEAFARDGRCYGPGAALTPGESDRLTALAAQAGAPLPVAALRGRGLSELDAEILLLAVAPGVDPAFATLYGYVNDALAATSATPHLCVEALATGSDHERRVIAACGPFGALRGEGWLTVATPERGSLTPLRPADGVLELLWGAAVDLGLLGDRSTGAPPAPATIDAERVHALAGALAAGRLDVVGVWDPDGAAGRAVAAALAGGRPAVQAGAAELEATLQRASISGAV